MKISTTYTENKKQIDPTIIHNVLNMSQSGEELVKQTINRNNVSEMTNQNGEPTEQAYQTAVNKMNEFMEHTQKNSKFVFHKELERYYVEIVDSQTQEVVKEIPPKELLDAYYEMQKLVGKMFDTQA